MNNLYYQIKPFLPWRIRMAVRRWFAERKRRDVTDIWPKLPGSEKPPVGWTGWPRRKQFAFVLTHDVEGQEGLSRTLDLMRIDLKLGFQSSFNFVPEGQYVVSDELREKITRNGCEVGVHDLHHDGKLFQSRTRFKQRARRINQYLRDWDAAGFRSGFMLKKFDWLHDLHIQYDASSFDTDPFEPQPEGVHTIFPFWIEADPLSRPAHAAARKTDEAGAPLSDPPAPPRGYLELPYTLPQDSTLFLLLRERSIDLWIKKVDWIARHGGLVLVDIHPDYIQMAGAKGGPSQYPVALYEALLRHIRSTYRGEYWQPLPRELAAWYRKTRAIPSQKPHETYAI